MSDKKNFPFKTKFFNFFRKVFTHQPFEKVLLSVVRGKKYLGFWCKFIPNPVLYKFNSIRNVNRQGINYSLDISCMMQWPIYWDLQSDDRDKLYSLVKKGDVIFDVGTNIGETLLNFAKLTGENGYVYGFEPDEENYRKVQKNISLNDFKNLHVFKYALSDKKETVKLFCVDPHNRGMNRILNADNEPNVSYTTIEAKTLDEIVETNKISSMDLMKIDIEGHEMFALKGAVLSLKKFNPTLFIEVAYERMLKKNTSPNELIKFLEDLGYDCFHWEKNKKITSQYDFSYLGDGLGLDVIAIPGKQ